MADFSSLLRKPAGMAKKPEALPKGDYQGVIKSFELGDANKNRTPYVRFHLGLVAFPDTLDHDATQGIDLSKRQLRRDFFLTDDAMWRLDALIRSVGIEPNERPYEEILPEMVGQQVLVGVDQYLNPANSEVGNQVGSLTGAG